jgi:hypothetical protein
MWLSLGQPQRYRAELKHWILCDCLSWNMCWMVRIELGLICQDCV